MQLHEELMGDYPDLKFIFDPIMPKQQKGWIHGTTVYLNPEQNTVELNNTVSEEIAHYLTGAGNITAQATLEEKQQEQRARDLGATMLVPPKSIIACFKASLSTYWECADFLNIPIETLQRAINVYARTNEGKLKHEHYTIYFNSNGTVDIIDWLE